MPDGFDLLQQDHIEVQELFARYAESADDATARELCAALTRHAYMEEAALYPELRRLVDGGDDFADEAEQEHAAVKVLIERIELAPAEDLADTVSEMRQLVEAHVAHEEGTLFPEMREAGVDVDELARRLDAARREVLTRESNA